MSDSRSYSEKLRDPRWQRKRLEILERDGWRCQGCGSTTETLHVHHGFYDGRPPWEYPTESLWTLCADCHRYDDEQRRALVSEIGHLDPILMGFLRGVVASLSQRYESQLVELPLPEPTEDSPPGWADGFAAVLLSDHPAVRARDVFGGASIEEVLYEAAGRLEREIA